MSKHVDLIAIGALLLACAVVPRVHERLHSSLLPARLLRIHTLQPVRIVPPVVPHFPRLPRLPRV